MSIITESIDNPPEGAICRYFSCYVCGKEHLGKGKIATVWNEETESYHRVGETCFDKLRNESGESK